MRRQQYNQRRWMLFPLFDRGQLYMCRMHLLLLQHNSGQSHRPQHQLQHQQCLCRALSPQKLYIQKQCNWCIVHLSCVFKQKYDVEDSVLPAGYKWKQSF